MKTFLETWKVRIVRKLELFGKLIKSLSKFGFCSVITGIICGLIGALFYRCIAFATTTRLAHSVLIYAMPFGGLIIVFLYKTFHMLNDGGTNRVIRSIRTEKPLQFRMAPLIFIATVITHLFGGSAGREGAALQIGGSLGSTIAQKLKLSAKDIHVVTMCGMSAVFAALFGTPITATIFSMEVISVGVLYYVAFIPCLLSSIIAFSIAKFFGMKPEHYKITHIPELNIRSVIQIVILSALCAIISMAFCYIIHKTTTLYKRKLKNQYLRIFVGGILIVLLTLLVQTHDYNGAGMDIVAKALSGKDIHPTAFLLKILFTAMTLAAGFKGGEIVPSFFIGATFGNVIGGLLGLHPGFGAAVGLISVFCGVVNCPIASLLLSVELFGAQGLILFCLACAISYVVSGYYGLYSSQKIVYSKFSPTYINKSTY
ncbi:MAG: chloride channel protein [Lachnospiraceae bacterium]|nr:chloride channel protein [Lachnospiraceae bacterium]